MCQDIGIALNLRLGFRAFSLRGRGVDSPLIGPRGLLADEFPGAALKMRMARWGTSTRTRVPSVLVWPTPMWCSRPTTRK
jgi:hypothetical protein